MSAGARVAVAYNAYAEGAKSASERASEEAVAGMAGEVRDCLTGLGCEASLVPLESDIMAFAARLRDLGPQAVVNLCEGFNGRPQLEANVAAAFELLGLAFTGSSAKALSLCQDKYRAKALLMAHGLPTPQAQLAYSADEDVDVEFPVIVKPNFEDASLGIYADSIVRDKDALQARIGHVVETYKQPALAERFIDGREFNVAVFEDGGVKALPVSEIDFTALPEGAPRVLGYEAKWFEDHPLYVKTPPVCPAVIEDELREKLQFLAVTAFKVMDCRDYARVDFRMDGEGSVHILEVNPNPDISANAGYARALKAAGIAYADFWKALIANALLRSEER